MPCLASPTHAHGRLHRETLYCVVHWKRHHIVQNKTGSGTRCPERLLVQLHTRHLTSLCINACPHLSNLQHNNANPFHDSRGDGNREIVWLSCGTATVGWDHFFKCNWLCYCSLSQCVKGAITSAGTLLINQTPVFGERHRDPPYLLQPAGK